MVCYLQFLLVWLHGNFRVLYEKKIAIIGSTGTIGKNLLDIIYKDKKNFEILLLTAHKNYIELFKQAKKFKVKNLIITDPKSFNILRKKNKK